MIFDASNNCETTLDGPEAAKSELKLVFFRVRFIGGGSVQVNV